MTAGGPSDATAVQVVFLHGPAAAGKLTTARALARTTGFAVFHNHLVVDALLALLPFGSAEFVRLRDRWWIDAFQAAAEAGRSFVFTFAPEPTVPSDFADRAAAAVLERGGRVHFVALEVSPEEQEARIENPDRRELGKLADLETLRRIRREERGSGLTMPADLIVQTDRSSAEATAAAIRNRFGLIAVQPHRAYPG